MTNKPIKFLLVDDLDANLIALEALLARDGLELLKARSGPEALEILLEHDVALALVDVQMAGMDGFELAELMRGVERTRRVPIIFLTAGAISQQRRFRGYEAGAVDFIFKPVEPHILKSKTGIFFELALQRDALRRSMEEAQAANRAKDDFLAALSHELRTPLTPVLMTAAALERDTSTPVELRSQLTMIRRNVELEARLIDDLLDITRITRGKLSIVPVVTDLHQLLKDTVEIVRNDALDKQISVSFFLEASRFCALVDPARMQQVFWNLVKNAFKFTPQGGRVTLRTRNDDKGAIVLSVEDTGIGISTEALPRIFDAFDQGDAARQHRYGGLGLGLAISRAITEIHGGTIIAESKGPGQGALFTVSLAAVDTSPSAPGSSPQSSRPEQTLRLLVVEDHEATRSVLARLLARDGHNVTTASNIQDAVEVFAREHFDVVICDLGLPDGTGIELIKEIHGIRQVPGIALSGYGMEEDLQKTQAAGFFAHLVKPIDFGQLQRLLLELH